MRPTKYTPDLGEKVIGMMKEGMSIEEVCLELDLSKQTFYNWLKTYPEFLDAKKRGLWFAKGWWMKQGRTNIDKKEFNATLFYMNMKNRFGWKDRQELDHRSKGKAMASLPAPSFFITPEKVLEEIPLSTNGNGKAH